MYIWGLRIKELREMRGLTQKELAEKSGVSRGHLSRIEIGAYKSCNKDTFGGLARGLGMTTTQLNQEIGTTDGEPIPETPLQTLERLRISIPDSIPVYTDYPMHAGKARERPVEYIHRARDGRSKRELEGYRVQGNCLEPLIMEGDIIIIDREAAIDHGDYVATLCQGELRIGKLKKMADELWLENNHGTVKLEECQASAKVIERITKFP